MQDPISWRWIDDEFRRVIDPVTFDRLLLIVAHRDYPRTSAAELARIVAVTESRVRSWRAILTQSGPTALLNVRLRRSGKAADSSLLSKRVPESPKDMRSAFLALSRFHQLIPGVDDGAWMRRMQDSLRVLKPDAHRASLTIRLTADFASGDTDGTIRAMSHVVGEPGVTVLPDIRFIHLWKQHLHAALYSGAVTFSAYRFPIARDYHHPNLGESIGATFFFREIHASPFTIADHDIIDAYQPFLTTIFLSRILWLQERNSLARSFSTLLSTFFPGDRGLTQAEEPVALQLLLGKGDQEIADALHLNVSTVRSHVRKILKKSGFNSRGQLIASVLIQDMFSSDPPTDP